MDISILAARISRGSRIHWVGMVDGHITAIFAHLDGARDMIPVHIGTDEESMPQLACAEPDSEMLPTTVLPRSGNLVNSGGRLHTVSM